MDLKECDILGARISEHWYYVSKANALSKIIACTNPHKILDVGAGSAYFSRYLLNNTNAIEACCVDTSYDREYSDNENGKNLRYCKFIDKYDANLVLLMDVLEHVEDDVELLNSYINRVPRGTYFLISVPAYKYLWSEHDEFLEHKRRYSQIELVSIVKKAGLQISGTYFFFGILLPFAAITRLVSKFIYNKNSAPSSQMRIYPIYFNLLLIFICKLEVLLMNYNRLGGLTIFCLARKPLL